MSPGKNHLISHTSIYMLGDILRRVVSLIMLPIYTRYLTPADYGVVELLSMLLDFASIIFGARVGQAVFRYYCTAESEHDRRSIISSALALSVVLNGLGAFMVTIFSGPLAIAIFSDESLKTYIALYSISMLLAPFMDIPLVYIRAQQKPWVFLVFSITKLALQLSLNIYLVVILEMHVEGVIYSAVISSAVMSLLLLGYTIPRTGIHVSMRISRNLFSFSLPLKLATIGSFYLTFGDRYILNIYADLTQVGIYALGYKFGFILLLLTWDPFENMWDAEKYAIYNKPNAITIYQRVFLYSSSILVLVGLCISLYSKDLITFMADPAFLDAYRIVPIIIIAYILQAWTRYCDLGILLKENTNQIALAGMVGVLVITAAYFTLIPLYGIYGAAWSTVIGFLARFLWTYWKGIQHYNMRLPWGKVIAIAMLASVIYPVSFLFPEDFVMSIIFRTALVLLFAISYFVLPILSNNEKKTIWRMIRSMRTALTA
jgi:O-antigen/teichoic acid export membrane protein